MRYLLPPLVLTSITNLWERNANMRRVCTLCRQSSQLIFVKTYKVVDEAFLLLDVGDGGADSDVVRQLIKVAA